MPARPGPTASCPSGLALSSTAGPGRSAAGGNSDELVVGHDPPRALSDRGASFLRGGAGNDTVSRIGLGETISGGDGSDLPIVLGAPPVLAADTGVSPVAPQQTAFPGREGAGGIDTLRARVDLDVSNFDPARDRMESRATCSTLGLPPGAVVDADDHRAVLRDLSVEGGTRPRLRWCGRRPNAA